MKKIIALLSLVSFILLAEDKPTEEGKVYLKSDPAGAVVSLYRKYPDKIVPVMTELGKTPCLVKLPFGKHVLFIAFDGYEDEFVNVEVKDEKILKLEPVVMKPKKKQEFNIDVVFEDGWSISVDGKKLKDKDGKEVATPETIQLTAGKHSITLNKDGFKEIIKQIDVTKNETTEIKMKPQKSPQPQKLQPQLAILGKWEVTNETSHYSGTWEFKQDGTISSSDGWKGKWSVNNDNVKIIWANNTWELFKQPFDSEMTGDSWHSGKDTLKGKRL